jgi:iron complex outermembrane receptor protein
LAPTLTLALAPASAAAARAEPANEDLSQLSLEELLAVEVTSVSNRPQKLSNAAAAVFVITQDDIRRSGVTSIAEALRMAPGVQVARLDANKWAISIRGFNGRFANKLLVMIDGRSVYTPLFGGTYWDIQDTLLADIDRIEVVRGPGATMWGANAVNGVINIITKHARDTQGTYLTGGGTAERGFAGARHGGQVGQSLFYRTYAKGFTRDDGRSDGPSAPRDDWRQGRGGFRADWRASESDEVTVQGDLYRGEHGQTVTLAQTAPPFTATFGENTEVAGGNLLGRWTHTVSDDESVTAQAYFSRDERREAFGEEVRDTFDIDAQHQFSPLDGHTVVWGAGYRVSKDDFDGRGLTDFQPENETQHLLSAFVQDEVELIEDELAVTIGSKFEWNDYSGVEIQPSVRALWSPHDKHAVWGAVSRAVRTPTRTERGLDNAAGFIPPGVPGNPGPAPLPIVVRGDDDVDAEDLLAFEVGYRVSPARTVSIDVAGFYNRYRDVVLPVLRGFDGTALVTQFDNRLDAETYGVEVAANWQPVAWWRFQAAYGHLRIDEDLDGGNEGFDAGRAPLNSLYLRSSTDLTDDIDLDVTVRYVDDLPAVDVSDYVALDARIAWRPWENVELSLVGQNLLSASHSEFSSRNELATTPTEVERGVYGRLTVRF